MLLKNKLRLSKQSGTSTHAQTDASRASRLGHRSQLGAFLIWNTQPGPDPRPGGGWAPQRAEAWAGGQSPGSWQWTETEVPLAWPPCSPLP